MGRQIDMNSRLSVEDREYLIERGREYLIPANERRFGTAENPREPEAHEQEASYALSPFYNPQAREAAVYDVGGVPLPGTTLDYNTGRVADRENGVLFEPTGPGHTPGASDLTAQRDITHENGGFVGYDVDDQGNPVDDHIDDDIVEFVTELPNKTEIVKALAEAKIIGKEHGVEVEYNGSDNREALENALAIAYQDLRNAGAEVSFTSDEEESKEEDTKE